MNSLDSESQPSIIIDTDRVGQWNVYGRLQQLSIPCSCACNQPLKVSVRTASDAILLWSVIQGCTVSRRVAVERLETCWRKPVVRR